MMRITALALAGPPYLYFDKNGISVPYAYYVHFDHAGVERARELNQAFAGTRGDLPSPRSLRQCFGPDGAEYCAEIMSRL
jgi:hypothetical protein